MSMLVAIEAISTALDKAEVRYALIGGFAMALRGIQRSTQDLDLILLLEDLVRTDEILRSQGFQRVFHSANASTYFSKSDDLGRIDVLHAFRGPSLSMLERADRICLGNSLLPVVQVEDIIGLKIQAIANNPARVARDWNDIHMILEESSKQQIPVDWQLLDDYLDLFKLNDKLALLKKWYGSPDGQ